MFDAVEADEEGDGSEDTEAAIDETPWERDATELAGDECERDDGNAGDDAELDHPLVADGIAQRAEEGDSEDEVREGEPVGAVGEEGVAETGFLQGVMDLIDPLDHGVWRDGIGIEQRREPRGFALQREGGDTAENEADDENGEPEAGGGEELGPILEWGRHQEQW